MDVGDRLTAFTLVYGSEHQATVVSAKPETVYRRPPDSYFRCGFGTQSRLHAGSGVSELMVGWTTPSRMVSRLLTVHGEQDFLFFALGAVAPHYEGSVLATEAEARREGCMHRLLAGAVGHVIQVAARVGVRLVDGRR